MGTLFNLARTLVLIPTKNKNAIWKSPNTRRLKVKQLRIKTNPNFQLVNKSSRIGPHEILQSSMIDTVFYLLVKNNKGKGGGVGVKTEGG